MESESDIDFEKEKVKLGGDQRHVWCVVSPSTQWSYHNDNKKINFDRCRLSNQINNLKFAILKFRDLFNCQKCQIVKMYLS